MKCDNCQRDLDQMEPLEIELERYRGRIVVCSPECRAEWLVGYGEHVYEALQDLEVTP